MKKVSAHTWLAPKGGYDLVRLGKNNDGGYLVEKSSLYGSDILLSLGINDDWSFEKDFYERNRVSIQAFDGSVDRLFFLKNIWKAIPQLNRPRLLISRLKKPFEYKKFFRNNIEHHCVMVGYQQSGSRTLSSIFDQYVVEEDKKVFLKIDIEGWEYRILDSLILYSEYIEGMVIEFHDFDLHRDLIKIFLEKIPLYICHCHANNCSGLDDGNSPLTFEVTFTKNSTDDSRSVALPDNFDMPNDPNREEYKIEFDL